MIAGPLLLLLLPLAMGGIVYILLRWRDLAALLSVGAALALGFGVMTLPLDQAVRLWGGQQIALGQAVVFFGREMVMGPSDRLALALLFFSSAFIFFMAWRLTSNPLIFPVGLSLLSLSGGALLVRPPIYAALLIEIAAALSLFILQAEDEPPSRGGMRYLAFTTLAMPGILLTHWLLERYAQTPNDTGLLNTSAALLAISFSLLLGIVPFHTWIPAMVTDGIPIAAAFILTVGMDAAWFLLLDCLETYAWLSNHPAFIPLTFTAGTALIIVGGVLAAAQRRLGALVGYATLVDMGALLIALAMNSRLGLMLVFLSLAVRPAGVGLMAAGLTGLRMRNSSANEIAALRGAAWRSPWATVMWVVGGMSLAGLPASAGFTWRWGLYRALAATHSVPMLLLFLAQIGVLVGMLRSLSILLERPQSAENRSLLPRGMAEGRSVALIAAIALLTCFGVGLFPQAITSWAGQMVDAYTFFLP